MDTERFFWPILAKKVAELSKLDSQFQWKLSGEGFLQNLQIVLFLNIERKTFAWLSEKTQRGGAFKLLSISPWELFEENVFEKFVHFLWTIFGSFAVFQRKKFGRPLETAFSVSIENLFKKTFGKTNEIFYHFQTLSRKFSASFQVFRRGCWSWILRVQNNNLTKNSFISNFLFIFGHWENFLTNSRKKSCQNWILSFNGNFRVNVFCNIYKLIFFEYRSENFRLAVRKKSAGIPSCFLTLHGIFLRKMFLKSFGIFCGHFLVSFLKIEQEKFSRSLKTAFSVSIKSFWEKKLFWKTNEIFHHFQTLSRKFSASCGVFRRGCWNSNLRVQGNILTKNGFVSIFFFFGHWAKFLSNSRKKNSGVVKTGFSVSIETFGWKPLRKLTSC